MTEPIKNPEQSPTSILRRVWNWLNDLINSSKVNVPVDSPLIKNEEDKRYESIFIGIGEMPEIRLEGDIALNKKHFLAYMARIGEKFRLAGEVDGIYEQRNYAIYDIIKTRVLQIRAYLESIFQGEYDKADVDVKTKQEIFDKVKEEDDAQSKYAQQIKKRRYKNYKEFSPILGGIYLLAAALLIFADVPLAIKLTKEGFQLTQFWEVMAMSIGIALCTIYTKIYYDEYIGSSVEQSVTRFKDLTNIDYQNESELKILKWAWRRRFIVKTFILIFSFATILILGFFRFQVFIYLLTGGNSASGNVSQATLDVISNPLTQWAFILVTLLFPLIGGVCASLGFDRMQNYNENKNIYKESRIKEATRLKASKDLEEAKKRKQICSAYLKWCGKFFNENDSLNLDDNINFVEDYTLYFISCYAHGYERGMTTNNLRKEIFPKAEEFRKRIIAEQTAKVTQKVTPEQFYENLKNLAKNKSI